MNGEETRKEKGRNGKTKKERMSGEIRMTISQHQITHRNKINT